MFDKHHHKGDPRGSFLKFCEKHASNEVGLGKAVPNRQNVWVAPITEIVGAGPEGRKQGPQDMVVVIHD